MREIAEREGASTTDQELDALMQRVLLDSLKLDWNKELKPQPPFEASSRHQREIRRMLADPLAWARRRAKPMWKRAAQRAAVVLLVASLGLCGLMASSPAARAALTRWIVEWYETHITYRYTGADITGPMPRYEITELPEGYAEVESERIVLPNCVSIPYRNEETGKTLYLIYVYMQQGTANDFVTTDVEIEPVKVNGLDGRLFLEKDWENRRSTVTWIDPDGNLQFDVHAYLEKDDILRLAESVRLDESTK